MQRDYMSLEEIKLISGWEYLELGKLNDAEGVNIELYDALKRDVEFKEVFGLAMQLVERGIGFVDIECQSYIIGSTEAVYEDATSWEIKPGGVILPEAKKWLETQLK